MLIVFASRGLCNSIGYFSHVKHLLIDIDIASDSAYRQTFCARYKFIMYVCKYVSEMLLMTVVINTVILQCFLALCWATGRHLSCKKYCHKVYL